MKLFSIITLMGFALLLFFMVSFENPISTAVNGDVSITSLASDFKIAPNTPLPEGSNFQNVSVASDPNNGFLVTWINTFLVGNTIYHHNYACRISITGEMLDSAAIHLQNDSNWHYYCPSAVFAGGNWIIAVNQGGLLEWVGAFRLTPSGVVSDIPPVNILDSTGMATILFPTLATNGQEVLCVTGIAGEGLYGSIFDPDLDILVDKFLILPDADADTAYRISTNGNNFFITFLHWDDTRIKLVIVNQEGQILSTQNVSDEHGFPFVNMGVPAIATLNNTTYITYFDAGALWIRRYSADGNPIDSSPVQVIESQDFNPFLEDISFGVMAHGYTDLVWANESFRFFWPMVSNPGMSMLSFKPDLSIDNNQAVLLNSQCQCKLRFGESGYRMSHSIIRASSLGNKVLTAWIDGREGNGRVYGNFFDILTTTTISGKVSVGGDGLSNVVMNGLPRNPTTNASGYYSAIMDEGWSGTVTPTKAGYTFSPSSQTYTDVSSDQTGEDYTATILTYAISGKVSTGDASIKMQAAGGVSGVMMDGFPENPTTDASGNYSATVDYGWSGTVAPTKAAYSFSPPSRDYTEVTSDQQDHNYTASLIQCTLTIVAEAGGTTTPSPASYAYNYGTQVQVTAFPDSGYQFSIWSGDVSSTTNPITITMDEDKSITVHFTADFPEQIEDGDGGGKKGGCFIATAAYGSPLHPHLDILRDFRDKYLVPNGLGRELVELYYKYSPFVATLIAKHKALKVIVRNQLVPFIAFSYIIVHFGPIFATIVFVLILAIPIFSVSFYRRKSKRVRSRVAAAS
jgi:hypothetical protein